jgi:Domain of unknown function (DUF4190)
MGTAALVLGIVGLLGAFVIGLGAPFAIAGIVLGIIGLQKVKRGEATNRGQAIGGIVTGAVGVAIAVLWVVLIVAASDEIEDLDECIDQADTQAEEEDCFDEFGEDLGGLGR